MRCWRKRVDSRSTRKELPRLMILLMKSWTRGLKNLVENVMISFLLGDWRGCFAFSFKVFLECDSKIAGGRIFKNQRSSEKNAKVFLNVEA